MLNAFIIDNDPGFIEHLQSILGRYCADKVQVVESFEVPEDAVDAILTNHPDLVFLDIEMPRLSGFELLDRIKDIRLEVIFVTAHDAYAVRAFKYAAIDYLVKPVNPLDLCKAVARCDRKVTNRQKRLQLETLLTFKNNGHGDDTPLVLHTEEGLVFLKIYDIVRLEAKGSYTQFFLKDGSKIMVSKTLKDWEEVLCDNSFYRVHDSHLVNLKCIKKYIKKEGGHLLMTDNSSVNVARRRKEEFLKKLDDISSVY